MSGQAHEKHEEYDNAVLQGKKIALQQFVKSECGREVALGDICHYKVKGIAGGPILHTFLALKETLFEEMYEFAFEVVKRTDEKHWHDLAEVKLSSCLLANDPKALHHHPKMPIASSVVSGDTVFISHTKRRAGNWIALVQGIRHHKTAAPRCPPR